MRPRASFSYRLSILQMEVSLSQVFDDPVRGREFFEKVIRDNLDLAALIKFSSWSNRKVMANTPSRFSTCVITDGIVPSLHVEYKRCHIKQYFKRGALCAPRPPSTTPMTFVLEGVWGTSPTSAP